MFLTNLTHCLQQHSPRMASSKDKENLPEIVEEQTSIAKLSLWGPWVKDISGCDVSSVALGLEGHTESSTKRREHPCFCINPNTLPGPANPGLETPVCELDIYYLCCCFPQPN